MSQVFHALVCDYDGTLTQRGPPSFEVLGMLAAMRARNVRVVLATGRILVELKEHFPFVEKHFDAMVLENGGVLVLPNGTVRALAAPPSPALSRALRGRGVPFRHGQVLLATHSAHKTAIMEEIARLGLDAQLIHNRSELMVLPAGISKGTGAVEALATLGVSPHNAVAVGDAENDHSLLAACELGVAVENAIPALKAHADVVLGLPAGKGVVSLMEALVLRGDQVPQAPRWRVCVGSLQDGQPLELSATRMNTLVSGASNSGKSHFAGLLTERLITMGYCACVLDPEGDHLGLGSFRGALHFTQRSVPEPTALAPLMRAHVTCAVVDLCGLAPPDRGGYVSTALQALHEHRRATGLPHFIVLDEAHLAAGNDRPVVPTGAKGMCLVTYQPELLDSETVENLDAMVSFPRRGQPKGPFIAKGKAAVRALLNGDTSHPDVRSFTVGQRMSLHVRHWHKYVSALLPTHLRFWFRTAQGPTGRSAGNLAEFHHGVEASSWEVLAHHAAHNDLSKWIAQVIGDDSLAQQIGAAEVLVQTADSVAQRSAATRAVLQAVEERYLALDQRGQV